MARIIPPFIDDEAPPGEKNLFEMLAEGPDGWIVLHSVDVAPWNLNRRTEIDFVVIVPDSGILCIEVKSHLNISCEDGFWVPSSIKRSPFKQALDARHALYRGIKAIAPDIFCPPVVHCCVFPNAEFDLGPNLGIQEHELIDSRIYRRFNSGSELCQDLRVRIRRSIQLDPDLSPMKRNLTKTDGDKLAALLFPVRRRRPEKKDEIRIRQEKMVELLRKQQKPVLGLVNHNPRVIVEGGAGTGKTIIAMELARRKAELGLRTGLLCFNNLIGQWIQQQFTLVSPPLPNLICGSAIGVMAKMTGITIPKNPDDDFWENELLDRIEENLTDPSFQEQTLFDCIILDEAQDILERPRLWECILGFLKGGLRNGKYVLFGDFYQQVLGNQIIVTNALTEIRENGHPANWDLEENCRNFEVVGKTALILSGLPETIYKGFMRGQGIGKNYDIRFYQNTEEQLDWLTRWIMEFREMGYRPSDTTILSFKSPENSIVTKFDNRPLKRLIPFGIGKQDFTGYTSIHAFKGLENRNIILTDVDFTGAEFQRNILYTGMTRATESVRVLCAKSAWDRLSVQMEKEG